jgi:peroxin-14
LFSEYLKRYVVPLIAPPTPPQLEQDKKSIDDSFEKAFTLLDQLSKDTETLKSAEQSRTERLDAALTEVETVISELKSSSRRREEDSRRIGDEVRGLKDLIPKALDGQKESTDSRLQELNTELKSLKKLMGQRMNPAPASNSTIGASTFGRAAPTTPGSTAPVLPATNGEGITPKPASISGLMGTEATASLAGRSASPFSAGIPSGRAAIPAWQMAAAKPTTPSDEAGQSQQIAESS